MPDNEPVDGGAAGAHAVRIPDDATIVIAVRNIVLFPGVVAPVTINRPKSIAAAQQALRDQRPIAPFIDRRSADPRGGLPPTASGGRRAPQ